MDDDETPRVFIRPIRPENQQTLDEWLDEEEAKLERRRRKSEKRSLRHKFKVTRCHVVNEVDDEFEIYTETVPVIGFEAEQTAWGRDQIESGRAVGHETKVEQRKKISKPKGYER